MSQPSERWSPPARDPDLLQAMLGLAENAPVVPAEHDVLRPSVLLGPVPGGTRRTGRPGSWCATQGLTDPAVPEYHPPCTTTTVATSQ